MKIAGDAYLVVIRGIDEKNSVAGSEIFRIGEVQLVSFARGLDDSQLCSKAKGITRGIASLLKQGFYFSYHHDLTNTLQRISKMSYASSSLFDRANKRYVWNYEIGKRFMEERVSTCWVIPIIQGFVQSFEDEVAGKKLKVRASGKD